MHKRKQVSTGSSITPHRQVILLYLKGAVYILVTPPWGGVRRCSTVTDLTRGREGNDMLQLI